MDSNVATSVANINITANTAQAQAQIAALSTTLAQYNNTLRQTANASALNEAQSAANRFVSGLQAAYGRAAVSTTQMTSAVDHFGEALGAQKLGIRDYMRHINLLDKSQRQYRRNTIRDLATQQAEMRKAQVFDLGTSPGGKQSYAVAKQAATAHEIAAEKASIHREMLRGVSTETINWGKNTQWAGRQLMVGLTIPMTIFAGLAAKVFLDTEKALTKLKRVYGDTFTSQAETNGIVEQVKELNVEFAKLYGISSKATSELAAKFAAAGKQGDALVSAIKQTTRLQVLGDVDQTEAFDAVLALTSAFKLEGKELSKTVDLLNAVENQTVTSIQDLVVGIPKAGPVIKNLGGDVADLAVLLTAMTEAAIPAGEGANALKTGLARIVNPSKKTNEEMLALGINLEQIAKLSTEDLVGSLKLLGQELNGLSNDQKVAAISQIFGNFQQSRWSSILSNLASESSQASKVIETAQTSAMDLAGLAYKELQTEINSLPGQLKRAWQQLQVAILPIGEAFIKIVIPILDKTGQVIETLIEKFQNLPAWMKNLAKMGTIAAAVAGPIIMTVGVMANFIGYVTKGLGAAWQFLRILVGAGRARPYVHMTTDIVAMDGALTAVTPAITGVTNAFTTQEESLRIVTAAMQRYAAELRAISALSATMQGQVRGGILGTTQPTPSATTGGRLRFPITPIRRAGGGAVPGAGDQDTVPAMLTPGEFVIKKKAVNQFGLSFLRGINDGRIRGYNAGDVVQPWSTHPSDAPIPNLGAGTVPVYSNQVVIQDAEVNNPMVTADRLHGELRDGEAWRMGGMAHLVGSAAGGQSVNIKSDAAAVPVNNAVTTKFLDSFRSLNEKMYNEFVRQSRQQFIDNRAYYEGLDRTSPGAGGQAFSRAQAQILSQIAADNRGEVEQILDRQGVTGDRRRQTLEQYDASYGGTRPTTVALPAEGGKTHRKSILERISTRLPGGGWRRNAPQSYTDLIKGGGTGANLPLHDTLTSYGAPAGVGTSGREWGHVATQTPWYVTPQQLQQFPELQASQPGAPAERPAMGRYPGEWINDPSANIADAVEDGAERGAAKGTKEGVTSGPITRNAQRRNTIGYPAFLDAQSGTPQARWPIYAPPAGMRAPIGGVAGVAQVLGSLPPAYPQGAGTSTVVQSRRHATDSSIVSRGNQMPVSGVAALSAAMAGQEPGYVRPPNPPVGVDALRNTLDDAEMDTLHQDAIDEDERRRQLAERSRQQDEANRMDRDRTRQQQRDARSQRRSATMSRLGASKPAVGMALGVGATIGLSKMGVDPMVASMAGMAAGLMPINPATSAIALLAAGVVGLGVYANKAAKAVRAQSEAAAQSYDTYTELRKAFGLEEQTLPGKNPKWDMSGGLTPPLNETQFDIVTKELAGVINQFKVAGTEVEVMGKKAAMVDKLNLQIAQGDGGTDKLALALEGSSYRDKVGLKDTLRDALEKGFESAKEQGRGTANDFFGAGNSLEQRVLELYSNLISQGMDEEQARATVDAVGYQSGQQQQVRAIMEMFDALDTLPKSVQEANNNLVTALSSDKLNSYNGEPKPYQMGADRVSRMMPNDGWWNGPNVEIGRNLAIDINDEYLNGQLDSGFGMVKAEIAKGAARFWNAPFAKYTFGLIPRALGLDQPGKALIAQENYAEGPEYTREVDPRYAEAFGMKVAEAMERILKNFNESPSASLATYRNLFATGGIQPLPTLRAGSYDSDGDGKADAPVTGAPAPNIPSREGRYEREGPLSGLSPQQQGDFANTSMDGLIEAYKEEDPQLAAYLQLRRDELNSQGYTPLQIAQALGDVIAAKSLGMDYMNPEVVANVEVVADWRTEEMYYEGVAEAENAAFQQASAELQQTITANADMQVEALQENIDRRDKKIKGIQRELELQREADDAEIKGYEDKNEALQDYLDKKSKAWEKEKEALEEKKDALGKEKDKINELRDSTLDLLDAQEKKDEYAEKRKRSQIDLATAIEMGDMAGAANIQSQMDSDEAAYQKDQTRDSINDSADKKIEDIDAAIQRYDDKIEKINEAEEALREKIQAQIDLNNKKIESIRDAAEARELAAKKEIRALEDANEKDKERQAQIRRTAQEAVSQLAAIAASSATFDEKMAKTQKVVTDTKGLAKLINTKTVMQTFGRTVYKSVSEAVPGIIEALGLGGTPGVGTGVSSKSAEQLAKEEQKRLTDSFAANGIQVSHGGGMVGNRAGRSMSAGLYPDEVPTLLQKGEYVMSKKAVKHVGVDKLSELNAGVYHDGGVVTDSLGNAVGGAYGARRMINAAGVGLVNKLLPQYAQTLKDRYPVTSGFSNASFIPPADGQANNGDFSGAKYTGKIGSVGGALAYLNAQMASGVSSWRQLCERLARTAYGLPGMYPSAKAHWNAIPNNQKRGTSTATAPAGALGFWNTGPYGHIAVSAGGGAFYTNLSNGRVGILPASQLNNWGPVQGVTEPWWSSNASVDLPSLAVGGHVMKDNVMANLHNGEVVLTKPLSRDLQAGIAGMNPDTRRGGGGIHNKSEQWNITVDGKDEKTAKDIVRGIMSEVEKRDRFVRSRRAI
jgi:TP901 family phage tail tape measure protein